MGNQASTPNELEQPEIAKTEAAQGRRRLVESMSMEEGETKSASSPTTSAVDQPSEAGGEHNSSSSSSTTTSGSSVAVNEEKTKPPKVRACQTCGVNRNADGTKLQKCENCLRIRYCSVPCQKKDRARHRPECRDIVKAKKLKRSRRLAESLSMQGETKSAASDLTTKVVDQQVDQPKEEEDSAHD